MSDVHDCRLHGNVFRTGAEYSEAVLLRLDLHVRSHVAGQPGSVVGLEEPAFPRRIGCGERDGHPIPREQFPDFVLSDCFRNFNRVVHNRIAAAAGKCTPNSLPGFISGRACGLILELIIIEQKLFVTS